jgi:hypothetical protein
MGFEETIKQTIPHIRRDTEDYQLADFVLFALVGMVGAAMSIKKVM